MKTFITGHAQRCLAGAQQLAEDAEYRRSLAMTPAEESGETVAASIYSDSSFWHLFEFGSANNPAEHILERAVTGASIEFRPQR